jgi:feruloyl esterase
MISVAQSVPAGTFTPPSDEPIENLPDFCPVEGMIKTAPDFKIQFEVWLPSSGWNGKLHAVGNWGFAGYMDFMPWRQRFVAATLLPPQIPATVVL